MSLTRLCGMSAASEANTKMEGCDDESTVNGCEWARVHARLLLLQTLSEMDIKRPKRQPKPSSDEGFWDCSVCTYKNTAEAFKCMMCDVRKGTSTRKPRPVSQLVSQQQVTQQFVLPSQPKKEKKERVEREKSDREPALKKNSHKKMRPRLKNIDRSSAQHLEVTVGDLTVIITDFKEKVKPSSTSATSSSAASSVVDHHSQNGSSSENTEKGLSRSSSPRGEGSSVNGESH
ncbi:YY1-associated factor 2-like isoform X1 [Solea solea]|nr:YY1-associated factor 2-like isoform X1 [Solea solea]